MKILLVSHLFPPHHIGGYGFSCGEIDRALRVRGHEMKVLTSTYLTSRTIEDDYIYRWLVSDLSRTRNKNRLHRLLKLLRKEFINQRAFKKIIHEFQPDLVYVWQIEYISTSLIEIAHLYDIPVCIYTGDLGLTRLHLDRWYDYWARSDKQIAKYLKRIATKFLEKVGLRTLNTSQLGRIHFASYFLKQAAFNAGIHVEEYLVTHWGVNLSEFPYRHLIRTPQRLLYVGRLTPEKGVSTLIEAFHILLRQSDTPIHLSLVGGGPNKRYVTELRGLIQSKRMDSHITFLGHCDHKSLPEIYRDHDILIFPSIVEEGFGITVIEAMASGLAVIGTGSGGSGEILQHNHNSLVFPPGDEKTLAAHILRLVENEDLVETLRRNGRQTVETYFDLEAVVQAINDDLLNYVSRSSA